jgi:hypothetical protein
LPNLFNETLIESICKFWRSGIGETGATTAFTVGIERKLTHHEHRTADIGKGAVHFSVFILKDSQFGTLSGKQYRLVFGV